MSLKGSDVSKSKVINYNLVVFSYSVSGIRRSFSKTLLVNLDTLERIIQYWKVKGWDLSIKSYNDLVRFYEGFRKNKGLPR